MKESGKKQRAAGCVWLDEQFTEESGEEYFEQDKRVKELVCKKGGSSRKASTKAQNEGSAAVKEGNTPTLDNWLLTECYSTNFRTWLQSAHISAPRFLRRNVQGRYVSRPEVLSR